MNKSSRTLGKVKQQQQARQQYLVEQKNFDMQLEAQQFTLECRSNILSISDARFDIADDFVSDVWQFIKENAKYPEIKVFAKIVILEVNKTKGLTDDVKDSCLRKWDIVRGVYKENND